MTSDDVLHDFFIPDFRIKNDVVPGQYTTIWFQAKEQGEHVVYCAEYCGTAHSKMLAKLKVVSVEEWNEFMKEDTGPASKPEDMSMAAWGQQLYNEKGCVACHSIDGSPLVGPTFKGLWGRNEEMDKPAGLKLVVDENYIRESIEYPSVKIVKGYQDVMPTYKGQFSEEGLNAIIAFIKSLNK
jgi:Heme/copper-type cytochrome/quinol oxidases, subunit 2